MKPYTNKTDKIDKRKCLYSEIKANDKPRKKAVRRESKQTITHEVVQEAMRIVSKDVRAPKCVRDELVKRNIKL